MRSRRERRIEDLRLTVECLPERTKRAMLEGIALNTIIVGAYTDRNGGVCPMLAAHRQGGRTDLLAFAKAWDRFCAAKKPRVATERELRVLKAHLEASLMSAAPGELGSAIASHQASARSRREREARAVGTDWLRDEPTAPAVSPAEVTDAPERAPELV
jgi:hypothetical protein